MKHQRRGREHGGCWYILRLYLARRYLFSAQAVEESHDEAVQDGFCERRRIKSSAFVASYSGPPRLLSPMPEQQARPSSYPQSLAAWGTSGLAMRLTSTTSNV